MKIQHWWPYVPTFLYSVATAVLGVFLIGLLLPLAATWQFWNVGLSVLMEDIDS